MGWAKFLPVSVLLLLMADRSIGYSYNKCYCWNDILKNQSLIEAVQEFNPEPTNPPYTYTGVLLKDENTTAPCQCTDVTRVQLNLTLYESWAFQAAQANDLQSLAILQTQTLDVISGVDHSDSIITISANLLNVSDTPMTNWTVEWVVKGYNLTSNWTVAIMMAGNTTTFPNGSYFYPGWGTFKSDFKFVVLQCPGNPPNASLNGQRNWSSLYYPGVKATYACNQYYFITDPNLAYSQCSHDSIAWTTPQINLTCQMGCQSDPPQGPYFSIRVWKSAQRNYDNNATYMCMSGYQSIDGANGSSTCLSTTQNWTAIRSSFRCQQILCPNQIPQVPSFAQSDWDEQTVYIGTTIRYSCIDGFSPTVQASTVITCQGNGTWSPLPYGYRCINTETAIRLGIYYPGSNFAYDYYDNGIYKNKVVTNPSYAALFAYVTIPAVIAISLILLFLMCGTRVNSCIYWICTGNTRKTAYIRA